MFVQRALSVNNARLSHRFLELLSSSNVRHHHSEATQWEIQHILSPIPVYLAITQPLLVASRLLEAVLAVKK
jgi:hypothetical protein